MQEDLNKIHDELVEIKFNLMEIRKDVNYHIKRTDLAEARADKHEELLAVALKPINWLVISSRILKWIAAVILPILGTYLAYQSLK